MSRFVRTSRDGKKRDNESVSNYFSPCTPQDIKKIFRTFLYFLHGCAWHGVVAPFAKCRASPHCSIPPRLKNGVGGTWPDNVQR
jgi:hypothetical protein